MGWVGGEDKALLLLLAAVVGGIVLHLSNPTAEENILENFTSELQYKSVKTSAAVFSFATLIARPLVPQYSLLVGAIAAFVFVAVRDSFAPVASDTPAESAETTETPTKFKPTTRSKNSKKSK
jgi:hypothetical protein